MQRQYTNTRVLVFGFYVAVGIELSVFPHEPATDMLQAKGEINSVTLEHVEREKGITVP